jgi:hypothetical protein
VNELDLKTNPNLQFTSVPVYWNHKRLEKPVVVTIGPHYKGGQCFRLGIAFKVGQDKVAVCWFS